ncbi:MAG: metal-dependent transcriptional regulator, partial [Firmicutes bacterium]|nr:metal-dependent transcriptional regulator [Bacillota bacterium]
MKIQESAENYLETILILSQKNTYVRSVDIANELNFTKPSVSVAMKKLRESELITMDADGYIRLTAEGLSIASSMYERHQLLSDWLVFLGVSRE